MTKKHKPTLLSDNNAESGAMRDYPIGSAGKPTIGLEIHAELNTQTKMFCDSLNDPLEIHPNINICPVCMGHPGTLPVINKEAVKKVILTGLALGGKVAEFSQFERKNYFYPDLPKGYQISQYKHPLVEGGEIVLPFSDKKIRVRRVHLEEDTGRLLHESDSSLVDFNRAGVPLMELVTEPDLSSEEEASEFAEELRLLFRTLGVSDADMERGQMRLEANVSLSADGGMGTKVELKNINSFNALRRAIEHELKRQEKILEAGKSVVHETRGWNDEKQKTVLQRHKEESHDYRYFPEPDLPPLKVYEDEDLNPRKLKMELPELPWHTRERLQREYFLESEEAGFLLQEKAALDFFEHAVSELAEWEHKIDKKKLIKLTFNYLSSDLTGLVKEKEIPWNELLATPEKFAELMKMSAENKISSRVTKDVLRVLVEEGIDPHKTVIDRGLTQVSNEGALEEMAKKIISGNQHAVSDYKSGKENAMQFLVGQIMRETKGSANPEIVKKVLIDLLK